MAIYDGAPSIRLEGDKDRALELVPVGKLLLYKVQQVIAKSGANTYSSIEAMEDGTVIYALSASGVNIVQISVPERYEHEEPEYTLEEYGAIPDIYSGAVYRGYLRTVQLTNTKSETVLDSFSPTANTYRRFSELPDGPGRYPSKRLAIPPSSELPELNNPFPNAVIRYSQYTKLRSSMYSGTMKKVVQTLLGLGRNSKRKVHGLYPVHPTPEYEKKVIGVGYKVRYDYKFARTHGITVAEDGKLWLVEISMANGVIAIPLPIMNKSDTEAFYYRVKNSPRNEDLTTVLDELGCVPTGQPMPYGRVLQERIAKGTALRLLTPDDLKPFYKHSPYSSVLGWAFNKNGAEAHNTGWRYGDDGYQRGVWYQINLNIGATKKSPKKGEPIATASASLVLQKEGFLHAFPKKYARYLPIKFHEPGLGGLLSHDGSPDMRASGAVPKCDTTMHVFFNDADGLETVSFFKDPLTMNYTHTDDPRYPGECMYANQWTITEYSGTRGLPTMMYTNKFDDRIALQERVTTTEIVSKDLGYDPPGFGDFPNCVNTAHVFRYRIFEVTTTTTASVGEFVGSVVAVPEFSRGAYYYANTHGFSGGLAKSVAVNYNSLRDPNHGYSYRCLIPGNYGCDYPGGCPPTTVCGAVCSGMLFGQHTPSYRQITCIRHAPYPCSEFADAGPWLTMCQNIDGFNQPAPRRNSSYVSEDFGTDQKSFLKLVSDGYGGNIPLPLDNGVYNNHWAMPSPDPDTQIVQYIAASSNGLGSELVVYNTNLVGYGETTVKGTLPDPLSGNDPIPCLIGVV